MDSVKGSPVIKLNRNVWERAESMRIEAQESNDEILKAISLTKESWYSYIIEQGLKLVK